MIFATMALSAQTERGRFIISGQTSLGLSYSSDDTKNVRSTGGSISQQSYSLNISPAVGYFIVDNFALSLQADYEIQDADYEDKMSQFTIMPTALYYIPTKGVVRPFMTAGAGYANVTAHLPIAQSSTARHSFSGFTWGVGAGIAFFINRNISLDLSLQYLDINTTYSGDSSAKIKAHGFAGTVGFSLYL